jgi:hypothetical protein
VLSDIAVWIYQGITKVMEEEVQPFLVVALLEHEGIGGLSGQCSPVLWSELRIQCRIRIRIHMFFGLPDPDPLVRGMDPDPSIIMQK